MTSLSAVVYCSSSCHAGMWAPTSHADKEQTLISEKGADIFFAPSCSRRFQ